MLARIVETAVVTAQASWVRYAPVDVAPTGARHLLIVSHDFPPSAITATQLPTYLARHAAARGWRVTVACSALPHRSIQPGQEALAALDSSIRLVRAAGRYDAAGEYYPRFPYRWSGHLDGGHAQQVGMSYAVIRALRRDPPTHVFATGPSFNNFVAGKDLARRFRVPLVLQYRDEWTVMKPHYVDSDAHTRATEAGCLKAAALVTFVTQGKLDAYRAAFPELDLARALVMRNGWDPDLPGQVDPGSTHLAALRGRLVLSFTGRVTPENPLQPLLAQLTAVLERDAELRQRLVLCMVGDQRGDTLDALRAFEDRFPGATHLHPPVTQVAALEIARESTMLLLLNNTRYPGVVPLKTFDYMISERPILAFGGMGEAGNIVEEVGAGLRVDGSDPAALQRALVLLADSPRERWNTPARQRWVEANNRATLNDGLLEAMIRLTPR
jgi:glycosyltransferase involved in cell wall biosynthesis